MHKVGAYEAVDLVQEECFGFGDEHRVKVFENEDAGHVRPRMLKDGSNTLFRTLEGVSHRLTPE